MTQEDFMNAYILLISGAAEMKNEKEIWYEQKTIEFPNLDPAYAIVRYYFDNGNIYSEQEYRNYEENGKYLRWYRNGNKDMEINYKNGKEHGRHLAWYEDGTKYIEAEVYNGKLNGKYLWWNEIDDNPNEQLYQNDIRIK